MSRVKSLHEAAIEEYEYQELIRSGQIIPSNTGFTFLNESLLGGTNTSDILTISGLSSAGKSTFANELSYNLATLNQGVRVLIMSYEVPGRKLAAKKISFNIKKSLREMYTDKAPIDRKHFEIFEKVPIDVIEIPINVNQIAKVIDEYCNKYHNDRVHIIFDHTLLVDNLRGESDMETLVSLANFCNKTKKKYNIVYILVSQLNDSMLKPVRLSNPSGHFPNQTDIFGARAIYHVSDCVIALVMPSRLQLPMVNGKQFYGLPKLPLTITRTKQNNTSYKQNLIYVHSIKTRDSNPRIDPLIDNLKYSQLLEFKNKDLIAFNNKYKINT